MPADLDDDDRLEARLFPPPSDLPPDKRPKPDWAEVHRELRRQDVTLALLWEEHKGREPDGFGYEQRKTYKRPGGGFPSDVTDGEWAVLGPLIPDATPGGRARKTDMRSVMNAVLFLLPISCPWRYLPRDGFPSRSTVYNIFRKFKADDTWHAIWDWLYPMLREHEGRERSPSAGIIDSQTIKSLEKGGVKPRNGPPTQPKRWVMSLERS